MVRTPMLVGEVARMVGLCPNAIRAMENRGEIAADRTATGVRLFNPADVERLIRERAQRRGEVTRP